MRYPHSENFLFLLEKNLKKNKEKKTTRAFYSFGGESPLRRERTSGKNRIYQYGFEANIAHVSSVMGLSPRSFTPRLCSGCVG